MRKRTLMPCWLINIGICLLFLLTSSCTAANKDKIKADFVKNGVRADVRTFGAVGDGIADDTAAVQAAINTGNPVYLPTGTYKISNALNITQEQTQISGDGMLKSVIKGAGVRIVLNISTRRVQLNDFKIEGSPSTAYGIYMVSASNDTSKFIMENVWVEGCKGRPGTGIYAAYPWISILNKVTSRGNNIGLHLAGGFQDTVLRDCDVSRNIQENIHLGDGTTAKWAPVFLEKVNVEFPFAAELAVRKAIVIDGPTGPIIIRDLYLEAHPKANHPDSLVLEIKSSASGLAPQVCIDGGRIQGSNNQRNAIKLSGDAALFIYNLAIRQFAGEIIDGIGMPGRTVALINTRVNSSKLYGATVTDKVFSFLYDAGGKRYTLTDDNKLGIGTDQPSSRLHVKGTADEKQVIVQANPSQNSNLLETQDSAGNTLFAIRGDGTVQVPDLDPSPVGPTTLKTIDGTLHIRNNNDTALADVRMRNLETLLANPLFAYIPTNTDWSSSNLNSGKADQNINAHSVLTGINPASTGLGYASNHALSYLVGPTNSSFSWDKKLCLSFRYSRTGSDPEVTARVQIKNSNAEGALTGIGLGIRVDNLNLKGESYGAEPGIINLATTLELNKIYNVDIIHYPGSRIEWWIDGIMRGAQSEPGKLPTGVLTGNQGQYTLVHSIVNGSNGGVDASSDIIRPYIWREP